MQFRHHIEHHYIKKGKPIYNCSSFNRVARFTLIIYAYNSLSRNITREPPNNIIHTKIYDSES